MNIPGKRLILGGVVAVAALGVGGVAYAANNDPAPEPGYVTVEDDATTPSPSTGRPDCPENNGGNPESPRSEQNPARNA